MDSEYVNFSILVGHKIVLQVLLQFIIIHYYCETSVGLRLSIAFNLIFSNGKGNLGNLKNILSSKGPCTFCAFSTFRSFFDPHVGVQMSLKSNSV